MPSITCAVASSSPVEGVLDVSSDCTVDATDPIPTGDGIPSNSGDTGPATVGNPEPSIAEPIEPYKAGPGRSLPITDEVESTIPGADSPTPDDVDLDIPLIPSCSKSTHGNGTLRCPSALAGNALSTLELPKLAPALDMNSRVEPREGSGERSRLINGNARNGRRTEPVPGRSISAPLSELGLGIGGREDWGTVV